MRHIKLLLCLSSVGLLAAAAPVPSLKLFDGFRPGMWQMTPRDSAGSPGTVAPRCLANPDRLVHTGHSSANGDCGHTVVEDGADRATVTYVCKGQGYGRTSIRREGDGFIVDAQGIDGRDPYELRGEYKRVGDC
ncbi:MAG: hypothetical protein Q7J32_17155 [Sphingomonadaceae bacterium]|nr:hypothetical protein [Sphingomonadaceae bacterium]